MEKSYLFFIDKKEKNSFQEFKKNSSNDLNKNFYYFLEMFMYTSGNVHMGHIRVFSAGDLIYFYFKYKNLNIFRPVGWDAFGLPAELASIKNGIDPKIWTINNIKQMSNTLKLYNFKQDWSSEINTSDKSYYVTDQEIFSLLYETEVKNFSNKQEKFIYQDIKLINYCDNCGVLSNEQSKNGRCWRCNSKVYLKETKQWFVRITAYAEKLYDDLDNLNWPKKIILAQKKWIGERYISFFIKELNKYFYAPDHIQSINIKDCNLDLLTVEGIVNKSNRYSLIKKKIKLNKNIDFIELTEKKKYEDKFVLNLHDWCISRQRKWGTPIPIIECENCGDYLSKNFKKFTLESPIEIECEICHKLTKRSSDTMDTFMSSSFYMWKFLENNFSNYYFDNNQRIDMYIGGAEHATLHLLYSRFITKFLVDNRKKLFKSSDEPFPCLINQGMVLNRSYFCVFCNIYLNNKEVVQNKCCICNNFIETKIEKMSKSKKNGLSADDLLKQYSSDTVKTYILSKGPFIDDITWDEKDIMGVEKFLISVVAWLENINIKKENKILDLNKILEFEKFIWEKLSLTIKSKQMKFNIVISFMFSLFKKIKIFSSFNKDQLEIKIFLFLLNLFASNIASFFYKKLFSQNIFEEIENFNIDKILNKLQNKNEKQYKKINVFLENKYLFFLKVKKDSTDDEIKKMIIENNKFISLENINNYEIKIYRKAINIFKIT